MEEELCLPEQGALYEGEVVDGDLLALLDPALCLHRDPPGHGATQELGHLEESEESLVHNG